MNALAQNMLALRSATNSGNQAQVMVLGKRIAKNALAVLHTDMPPECAPGLRHAVKEQMVFVGLAGVGMQLGRLETAAQAMAKAALFQKQAMAYEDSITGSDWGGW